MPPLLVQLFRIMVTPYRNVEEKDQHSVGDHGDVERHVVVDKTAERWREGMWVKMMVDTSS